MMKIDTRTENGETAVRVWGSSDPDSDPIGAFATMAEWNVLLEDADRASRDLAGGRNRG